MFEQLWHWLQSSWHRWLGTHKSSYERGNTLFRLGRYKEAITAYDRALQLKSDYQDAKDAHYRVSQINLAPYNSEVWYGEGLHLWCLVPYIKEESKKLSCLEESLFYIEAIAAYNKALQIQPNNYQIWCAKGKALANLEEIEEAIYTFEKVLELKPDFYDVWYLQGTLLGKLGRLHDAIECFDKVLEANPSNQDALGCKAYALKSLNRRR
jgi:tetratricopeptide (TPR) repeat protein